MEKMEKMMEEMEIHFEKEKERTRYFAYVGIALIMMVASLTLTFSFSTIRGNNAMTRTFENQIELLSDKISAQDSYISNITKQINESPQSVDVNINKIVEKLDSEYKKLQEIIIGNPANIIEFALLIKEVDALKESYKEHKESVYNEMNRNFGLFRWFIYINIFIALTILGIAATNYYQSRSIQKSQPETELKLKKG